MEIDPTIITEIFNRDRSPDERRSTPQTDLQIFVALPTIDLANQL
jgi:hypothetical protein